MSGDRRFRGERLAGVAVLAAFVCISAALPAHAESPAWLSDRGSGMATSMTGTYVQRGQLLIYPFFEYYLDNNVEYTPADYGFSGPDQTYHAKYWASEGILFGSYGLTDRIEIEMEAAVITARQEKDPHDPSAVPQEIKESGTGDVEGQIHYRLLDETDKRPELYSYFEAVSPQERDKLLIATPDWEFALGAGMIRGLAWGTVSARIAASYKLEDQKLDLGEYAVDYLRSLSSRWKVYAGMEGEKSDVSLITEAQWHFSRTAYLKLNSAFGLTPDATDWAPEVGIMFMIPSSR
jgi:hypothetical protein